MTGPSPGMRHGHSLTPLRCSQLSPAARAAASLDQADEVLMLYGGVGPNEVQ